MNIRMSIDQKTESLNNFMEAQFPSRQKAIRAIWKGELSELPDAIKNLPESRREAIVACYADNLFLTMEKYPEQLAKGYLWLTSCEPDTPHFSTKYARDVQSFFVGTDLPNFGFGYSQIEIQRKQINYRDEADRNSRKPLFVPIAQLKTDHMLDELSYYRTFRSVVDMVK